MNSKNCKRCGCSYVPAGRPGTVQWDSRKYCSRSCAQTRHGLSGTYEHRVWRGMLSRCYNANATGFKDYGGRGVVVCAAWRASFEAFISDMGRAPGPRYTIEREDNEKCYGPLNCKWALRITQNRNTRRTKRITFQGKTKSLAEWCETLGLAYYRTHSRIHKLGWPVERALTEATQPETKRHINFRQGYAP